jgi:hypothetical protein
MQKTGASISFFLLWSVPASDLERSKDRLVREPDFKQLDSLWLWLWLWLELLVCRP